MKNIVVTLRVLTALLLIPGQILWAQEISASPDLMMDTQNGSPLDPTGQMFTGGNASATQDLSDHKAEVFFLKGEVKLMKKGGENWQPASKGMVIEPGDQILTGVGGYLEVAYDKHFLDIARIGEKTHAEFLNIEPTTVILEDGSIFSALDGLPKGSEYKVTTPTAVAAVRGTHFDVSFSAETKEFFAATIPVPDDGHESAIEVTNLKSDGTEGAKAMLQEGIQVRLAPDQIVDPQMLKPIDPQVLDRAKEHFDGMSKNVLGFDKLREEGKAMMLAPLDPSLEKTQANQKEEKNSDAAMREKQDDDRKPVKGPNDGGGPDSGNKNFHRDDGPMEKGPMNQMKMNPDPMITDHSPDSFIDSAMGQHVDQMMQDPSMLPKGGEHITGFVDPSKNPPPQGGPGFMAPQGTGTNPISSNPFQNDENRLSGEVNRQDPLRNLPPLDSNTNQRSFWNDVIHQQQEQLRSELHSQQGGGLPPPVLPPPPFIEGGQPQNPPQGPPPPTQGPPPEQQQPPK